MTKRGWKRGGEGMVEGTSELEVHQAGWEGRERVPEFKREGEVGDSGWQMRDGMLEVC